MKSIYSKLVLVSLLLVTFSSTVSARECIECKKTNARKAAVQTKAAACKRAQSTAELNINNVRALINGYGNMWYDGSVAQYHLPKNSNTCPLFCAALWIGGTDVNYQLRIAALRFGSEGDDYWTGPLKIDGTASVDLPICNRYDKHYIISKAEVLAFMDHFDYTGATPVQKSDPGDDLTEVILNWPAKGEGAEDLTSYLAPFYDADGDGMYNPHNGDYPYYDFNNDLCPRTIKQRHPELAAVAIPTMETEANIVTGGILSDQVLKGDQTIWWVFNDMGNTHTETNGQPIGLEIRAQAFAFSTNDRINDMTFYSYEIINRSTYELRETYFSQWVDADLGYAWDDFVGCDVRRGLGYCYNGDGNDGPGSGSYNGIPPAVGIDFFQGPYMDPDGKDNPKIDIEYILGRPESEPVRKLLDTYKLKKHGTNIDSTDAQGRIVYDTIDISYHADDFFTCDYNSWYFKQGDAIGNCAINGVNFGNNIVDDERFGMRRFVYYDNGSSSINGEPAKASDYYYYLRGYWKNGQRMKYGGNAISTGTTNLDCDFMFPYDSDPWHWGTDGQIPTINPDDWNEITAGNTANDRRFMQSAGPFTLKPGALNYITVGIPFAQASSGNNWASVQLLRQVDDVCQRLFENCFKVLDGPDAPTLTAQELTNEVVLYLTYENPTSNNYGESYIEASPSIPSSYTDEKGKIHSYDVYYRFEGYQIYQLKDANCSIADIEDETKAQLVAQCDIENYYDSVIISTTTDANGDTIEVSTPNDNPSLPISTLVNFTSDTRTGILSGKVMVEGSNTGIQHVFRVTKDAFATGTNTNLVNNREYYFIAIAYAHNRYKEYSQTEASYLDGQKEPYLAGRKSEKGGSIKPITVIPHSPSSEDGGKQAQAEFGMSPRIIRLGGHGNGGSTLRISQASIDTLMGDINQGLLPKAPGLFTGTVRSNGTDRQVMSSPCIIGNPMYEENYGPISVRVIDPLKLHEGRFNILFSNSGSTSDISITKDTRWCIVRDDGGHIDSTYTDGHWTYRDEIWSDFEIGRHNEQLFLDLGIAVTLVNPKEAASEPYIHSRNTYCGGFVYGVASSGALLSSSMNYADENKQWLSGIPDNDSYFLYNWIRSGSQFAEKTYRTFMNATTKYSVTEPYLDEDYFYGYSTTSSNTAGSVETTPLDKDQMYEDVVYGLWGPYGLTSTQPFHPGFNYSYYMPNDDTLAAIGVNKNSLERSLMVDQYNRAVHFSSLANLPSVQIVITADTSKWTRCPVIEQCDDYTQSEGNARRFSARRHASVNKLGKTKAEMTAAGITYVAGSIDDPEYISANGMGWFPGYAINTVSGERLNIMFGEDSRYVQHNGADMIWNPDNSQTEGTQNYTLGGRHYIYVMNATRQPFCNLHTQSITTNYYYTPSYDAGRWAMKMLSSLDRLMTTDANKDGGIYYLRHGVSNYVPRDNVMPVRDSIALLYASVAWVNMPLVNTRYLFTNPMDIPTDVTINIDVRTPYDSYLSSNRTTSDSASVVRKNREMPAYQFVISSDEAVLENLATRGNAEQSYIDSLLGQINVVPNPYYSYSAYETASQLETKVRIVNLPTGVENGVKKGCTIRIYTVDGTLVRTLGPTAVSRELSDGHNAENTTVDWDLHNQTGIPIAGGMYLIHVTVPGIGERVIKWFGTMRPVDLNSFGF
ncbi:MAG: hypothetical protein J5677_04345 [Bacteroidales bacterium]|nr:hypothetical protein [Bacteroidales bacterium]